MEAKLEAMTIRSPKIHARVLEYLDKVCGYDNFDKSMLVRVYVDDTCDFIAFEGVKYRVQFTSNEKKLVSLVHSVYEPIVCNVMELVNHVVATIPDSVT